MFRKFLGWLNDIEIKLFVYWWMLMEDLSDRSVNRHK